jgi:hypothetical protein
MPEQTFKSLLHILDWLEVGGFDEPTDDIQAVQRWADEHKDDYPSTRES